MGHPQFRSRKLAPEAAASLAACKASSATLVAIWTPAQLLLILFCGHLTNALAELAEELTKAVFSVALTEPSLLNLVILPDKVACKDHL